MLLSKELAADFAIDARERRTPTDGRTTERRILIGLCIAVKPCKDIEYGYWAYLNRRDLERFTTFHDN